MSQSPITQPTTVRHPGPAVEHKHYFAGKLTCLHTLELAGLRINYCGAGVFVIDLPGGGNVQLTVLDEQQAALAIECKDEMHPVLRDLAAEGGRPDLAIAECAIREVRNPLAAHPHAARRRSRRAGTRLAQARRNRRS